MPFFLALAAAVLLLGILTTGGLVTTAASLPDGTFAQLLLHRRAGEIGGTALLGIYAWLAFSQPQIRKHAGALAVGVGVEGLLGLLPLSHTYWGFLHGSLAHILLAGACALLLPLTRLWQPPAEFIKDYGWPSLRSFAVWLPAVVAVQVALGAAFRQRLLGLMPHVIGAMLATMLILIAGSFVLQQCKDHKTLPLLSRTMMVATFVQVFLGIAVYTVRSIPSQPAAAILAISGAHLATGGLVLGTCVILGVMIRRNVR